MMFLLIWLLNCTKLVLAFKERIKFTVIAVLKKRYPLHYQSGYKFRQILRLKKSAGIMIMV